MQLGAGLAVILIGASVALFILGSRSTSGSAPVNMADNGIVFTGKAGAAVPTLTTEHPRASVLPPTEKSGDGVAHITTYIDWSCPICKTFESSYATTIQQMVASGEATLEVHPVAILDKSFLGTRYSSRAANAAACMANYDPSTFLAAQTAFYASQPTEGTSGLTNDQIKKVLVSAGVTDSKVASCVDDEQFKSWVTATTAHTSATAALGGTSGFGTPTVLVNGKKWDNASDFTSFVASATK